MKEKVNRGAHALNQWRSQPKNLGGQNV